MNKWLKRILITVTVLSELIIGANWILKEAFGPKHRTVNIKLDDNRKLICEETYNADLAEVFYDIEFSLTDKNKGQIKVGRATYSKPDWEKEIKLIQIDNWLMIPAKENSYSKILLTNQILGIAMDTILSPQELRYDNLWKAKHNDIPAWTYSGSSQVDSVQKNNIYVSYEYRIGDYEPFTFYKQTIEYTLDAKSGKLKSKKVFDRQIK
jgi:hypothetical protein